MLATKPAETATGSVAGAGCGEMPHYKLAAATTEVVWAWAFATARLGAASTVRGLELWAHMLRARAEGLQERAAAVGAAPPPASASDARKRHDGAAIAPRPAESAPFASYRSPGGHATAQVSVSD
jgi:hypothetical protein